MKMFINHATKQELHPHYDCYICFEMQSYPEISETDPVFLLIMYTIGNDVFIYRIKNPIGNKLNTFMGYPWPKINISFIEVY